MIPILRFAWCVPPALALVLLGGTETASAQSQSEWNKRVENGDTLIGIARRFLREPLRWRELQARTLPTLVFGPTMRTRSSAGSRMPRNSSTSSSHQVVRAAGKRTTF